jgi:hypothetical protein
VGPFCKVLKEMLKHNTIKTQSRFLFKRETPIIPMLRRLKQENYASLGYIQRPCL